MCITELCYITHCRKHKYIGNTHEEIVKQTKSVNMIRTIFKKRQIIKTSYRDSNTKYIWPISKKISKLYKPNEIDKNRSCFSKSNERNSLKIPLPVRYCLQNDWL